MNDFQLKLQAMLDKVKTLANIKRDLKEIQPKIPPVKIAGGLNESKTKSSINKSIKKIKPKIAVDADTSKFNKMLDKVLKKKRSIKIAPSVDSTEFSRTSKEVEKQSQSLFSKLTNNIMGVSVSRRILQEFVNSVKKAISNVKELNRISTDVQMASGTTKSEVDGLMHSYHNLAKEISSTTKSTAENANTFIRMGENLKATNTLIKNSQMLSKIGMIENADSANYLISSMKGYKIAAQDSMSIVDKLTSVDMEAAVSAGGLAEAMSKTANLADSSGISMDHLIGYLATVQETTQKTASVVGTSFQSMLSRMNNIKIGKFIDDKTGEDLSDVEAVLGKLNIKLRNSENTYRNFDDVLKDVADHWKSFNDVERNAVAVAIAGTRQRENMLALFSNFDKALQLSEVSANSAGTALKRYEVYQDSLEAKTNQLINAFEGLSVNLFDDDMIGGILDATTALVEFVDKTNLLKGALAGLATAGILNVFSSIATGVITAAKNTVQLTSVMAIFNNGMTDDNLRNIGAACIGLSDKQLRLILSMKGLTNAQREIILAGMQLNETQVAEKLSTLGFANAENVATNATFSFTGALKALKVAFATNPIGMSIMAITTAVSVGTMVLSHYKRSQEESARAAQDAAKTYADTSKSIKDYAKRYEDLHQALIDAKGNEEDTYNVKKQLLDLQKELNDKYGEEYGNLNLVTDAYKNQTEAIEAYNKKVAEKYLNSLTPKQIEDAKEKMSGGGKRQVLSEQFMLTENDKGGQELKEIAKKYSDKGIEIEPTDGSGFDHGFVLSIKADPRDAEETIEQFMTDARNKSKELKDEHLFDDTINTSKKTKDSQSDTIKDFGATYDGVLRAEVELDDQLLADYNKVTQAVTDYNNAVLNSDNPFNDKEVSSAYDNLKKIKAEIQDNEEEWGKYSSVFNGVFDQADTKLVDFAQKIENNDLSLGSIVRDIKKLNLSDTDLEAALSNISPGTVFQSLDARMKHYGITIGEVISLFTRLRIVQDDFSKDQPLNKTKEEMISSINELSGGFESLDKIMASIKGKNPFDYALLDDKKFKDAFGTVGKEYTDFIEQISSSPKDIKACQGAFDNLVTAWLNSKDVLGGLSDDTKQLTIDMLSNMGVANAEEIVTAALADKHAQAAAQKFYDANASRVLTDNTIAEYNSLLNEYDGSELAKQALARLELAKIAVNDAKLDTTDDIDQLLNLSAMAGATANTLSRLQWAKSIYARVESGQNLPDAVIKAADDAVQNSLNTDYKDYKPKIPPVNYTGGTKSNKSAGGSKNKSKDPTKFDWMEQKIKIIDDQVDKLQDKIDILVGYKGKNATTDTIIDRLIEKMSTLQQMHDKYMEQAGELGLSQDYINKIQNGSIEVETIGDKDLAKKIKDYQSLYDKAEDANKKIHDTQKKIDSLNLSKLDNIINQFKQLSDTQSQIIDTEKQLIDLREKSGDKIYADDYANLIEQQGSLIKNNADAYRVLKNEMSSMNLKQGSEEWKKYNDQLRDYQQNMISAADAVKEYMNAIVELSFKGLNDFKSQMDSIGNTISTMSDLIGSVGLTDDDGKLTDLGLAKMALYAQQLANAKQEAANYGEAINSLDGMLSDGLITQDEYNQRLYDYTSAQNSAISASKQAKDAILDLVKNGIQAEIDAKKKLVDETKAALDAEQNLHNYQKSISEKQDNISKLERQIAALSNSTSRDDIAKRLQLQAELKKAQEELYETQYDHEVEQRKDALDKQLEDFTESKDKEKEELDSDLDKQNAAINKYLNQVKDKYSTVYGVLTQYGNEYSMEAIKALTNPWKEGGTAADLCGDAVGNAIANIQTNIDSLNLSPLYDLIDAFNSLGMVHGGVGAGGSTDFEDISDLGNWQKGQGGKDWFGEKYSPDGDYFYASDDIYTVNGKQYGFDDQGYMQKEWQTHNGKQYYFDAHDGHMVKSQWIPGNDGSQYYLLSDGTMAEDMAIKDKDGSYYYVDDAGKWDGKTLTAEQVRKLGCAIGYKRGTLSARKGMNFMDEDGVGSEAFVTNRGILKQFKGGETIFNPDMTENLWEFAKDPTRFISGLDSIRANTIDMSKTQPVHREQKIEVNMSIGGVLDEAAARVLNEQMPSILKKNHAQITDQVWKDTGHGMLGR